MVVYQAFSGSRCTSEEESIANTLRLATLSDHIFTMELPIRFPSFGYDFVLMCAQRVIYLYYYYYMLPSSIPGRYNRYKIKNKIKFKKQAKKLVIENKSSILMEKYIIYNYI